MTRSINCASVIPVYTRFSISVPVSVLSWIYSRIRCRTEASMMGRHLRACFTTSDGGNFAMRLCCDRCGQRDRLAAESQDMHKLVHLGREVVWDILGCMQHALKHLLVTRPVCGHVVDSSNHTKHQNTQKTLGVCSSWICACARVWLVGQLDAQHLDACCGDGR